MSAARPAPPIRPPGAATTSRDALLQAASDLMVERGDVDVSLSEIGARAGLNPALVKYYFGGRTGLMLALVQEVLTGALEQMNGLAEMDLDPVAKLRLHIKGVITVYYRYPYINRLIHALFLDPKAGEAVAKTISRPLAQTQWRLVREAIDAGLVRPTDPMLFYFIILGACDHLFFGQHVLWHAFGVRRIDDALRRAYTDTLLEMVLQGLLVRPEGA